MMKRKIALDFQSRLGNRIQFNRILPNLTTGLLIGFTEIIFAVSLGGLIFSGDLAPYISQGISIALASLAITTILITLTSSVPGIVTGIQENPAVLQGIILTGVLGSLALSSESVRLSTSLAILTLTSILSGLFFLLLGIFNLGGLVRYIPFPVVGGLLAGTGWLLIQASFDVMTGIPLKLASIPDLFELNQLIIWLPGLVLALMLIHGLKRMDHILTIPGIVIGAILFFYFILLVTGTSIESAVSQGLLLGDMPRSNTWHPISVLDLSSIDWKAILGEGGNIATILVMGVLSLLLNATGLELAIHRDIDINHELRSAGIANLFSGIGGGMIGFQALSESALSHRLGARGRSVGIVAAVIPIAVLFSGLPLLSLFPKMLVGGLLLFLGLDFLIEWVIGGQAKLPKTDYCIILLILVAIATTNFLTGVGIGLLATILLFVLNYSRINVIQHILSGVELRSNLERPEQHWDLLRKLGSHILILELKGYIFFGTAHGLLEQIRKRVLSAANTPVRYIIMDFNLVSGLDSSAVFSFMKIQQLAKSHNITILYTGLSQKFSNNIRLGDLFDGTTGIQTDSDLDHGLEWCEDRLLKETSLTPIRVPTSLSDRLADQGFPRSKLQKLMPYLERIHLEKGEYLIRQGDHAVDLYLIETGQLSVYLELGDEKRIRLQTFKMRSLVGEVGLYAGQERTASIMADEPCVVYRLSRTAMLEISEKDSNLAAAFHVFIANTLARRLADTTRLLAALQRKF